MAWKVKWGTEWMLSIVTEKPVYGKLVHRGLVPNYESTLWICYISHTVQHLFETVTADRCKFADDATVWHSSNDWIYISGWPWQNSKL